MICDERAKTGIFVHDAEQLTPAERRVLAEMNRRGGYIRDADLRASHIRPHALTSLVERGVVDRIKAGLYRTVDLIGPEAGLSDASAAIPGGIICLTSALAHYDLTTVTPPDVFVAIRRKAWRPKVEGVPTRVVYYNDRMYNYGARDEVVANGRIVRMYSPEKSIADAFHFQEIVGRDVAVEAIREYLQNRERNLPALREAARITKAEREMRPFIEALV